MKTYYYNDKKGNRKEISISEDDNNLVVQAERDFATSNKCIRNEEFFIWRAWLKSYHLSTYDRKIQLWSNNWKQNITIWLIRSFVDIMVASLNEKPLSFIGTAINQKWAENKEWILKTLAFISDVSWFHKQLKDTMANWLIIWEIAMRVGYKKTKKTEKYISIANDKVIEEIVEVDEKNYPYAVNVSIFNIFPDPYSWRLRYVTERDVVSYATFIEIFGDTIRSKKNKSNFKLDSFLPLLAINENGADLQDYWNIVNQIHEKVNQEFMEKDKFQMPWKTKTQSISWTHTDEDKDVVTSLIEYKATWYDWRLIILANNYPVYIWPNPYWFIPYVIKPSNQTKARFWEWIPYMLKWLEDVWNSFINNYFDSARSIANPTMIVQKNLMINDDELEDWTPWWVLYTEDNANGNAVYRLDKWWLQDFNVMWLINQIASQITGISEYDLWQSARERTATGALAVSQSSQKRLSPYVSNFLDAISIVAQMWLKLVKKYWWPSQMIYILDDEWNQVWESIKKTWLTWWVNISLEAEWMFWANEELKYKKIIELYNTLAPSWFAQSPELAKEIIKTAWYSPTRFITEPWQWVKPDNANDIALETAQQWLPWKNLPEDMWNMLWAAVTPNIDMGNDWQGNK